MGWKALVLVLAMMVGTTGSSYAQTGPGGVEDTTGNSDLRIWMDATTIADTAADGTVNTWDNLAGTNPSTTGGDPVVQSDGIGGRPVVRFDGTDDQFDFGTDFGVPGQNNTLIVVSEKTGAQTDQALIGFGTGNKTRRTIEYQIQENPGTGGGTTENPLGSSSGDTNQGNWAVSNFNTSNPAIFSSIVNGSQEIRASGDQKDTAPATTGNFGNGVVGQNVIGDVAEVIAFRKPLNSAELTIVHNYLSEKYGLSLSGNIADLYGHDSYPGDVAGIGKEAKIGQADGGTQTAAQSDILQIDTGGSSGSLGSDGEFLLFGHNEEKRSFSTGDRPNDDSDVERLSRVWRFAGNGGVDPIQLTVKVDTSSLSLGGSFDDYAVFVSSNSDFSSGATFFDLSSSNGLMQATDIEIEDGDYVAVARLKRTVTFTSTTETIDEGNKKKLSAVAELNYPDDSDITFSYNDTGDLDNSGSIEDGGTSNQAGTNNNGDYEADGGTGSQSPTDYDVTKDITTIPAGKTTNDSKGFTFEADANDDTVKEQTEKFGFTINAITSGAAQVGSDNQLTVSIFDNDEDRKVRFADGDYTDGDDDPGHNPQSSEGDGGTIRTNKYTIELDGGTSSTGDPCTSVKVVVNTASSDATPGTDLSAGSVADFRIKDETDPGGTCPKYQERVSSTEGRVYFKADTTAATLKLEINEDDFEDADAESIVLDLSEPVSSRLGDSKQQTTFNISDDDQAPTVGFTSSSFSGDESQDGEITLGFTNGPVGTDIGVELNDTGAGTAESGDYTKADFEGQTTIPEGSGTKTVSFSVDDDTQEEKNQDIVIEIQPSKSDADTTGARGETRYTILDNDGVGAVGPGGVGNSESLRVWLQADKGVTSSGGPVSNWADQSGNGNDVSQSSTTNQPDTSNGQSANGISLLSFDGAAQPDGDYFETANLTSLPNGPSTVIAVADISADGTLLGINAGGNNFNTVRQVGDAGTNSAEASQDGTSVNTGGLTGGLSVLDSQFDSDAGSVDINVNAGEGSSSTTGVGVNGNGTYAYLGAGVADGGGGGGNTNDVPTNAFSGDVGEVIIYERALNTAQRCIVANYLAAKYGFSSTTLTNDYYAGDTNAGFDQNVFGIGAEGSTAGTQHNRAEGDAITLSINSFSTGDYVFVGDTTYTSANDINVQDASGVTGLTARSEHFRYIDTKGQPTFDITIDLDKLGLQGPAGTASNYRLLYRGSYGKSWKVPSTVGGRSTSGDKVTFSGVQFNADTTAYITIGTTNQVASPLDTRLTTVRGNAGADQSDKGWRFYGPPKTGEVQMQEIQLRTPTGDRQTVSPSEANMAYIWDSGRDPDNEGDYGEWVVASETTPVPAGRGSIIFLYDDKYYPLDPELTIDVPDSGNNGTYSYTGDTDVTVGDDSPASDATLRGDVNSHLLANPYEVTYDLGSLQTLNQDGDSDGTNDWATAVQIWDTTEDTDGGDPRGTYKVRSTDPAKPESDRLINPGQAFFLERNDTNDDGGGLKSQITFKADGRSGSELVDYLGTAKSAASPTKAGQIELRLQVHDGGELVARDRAASLYFRSGADSTWDAFDAPKLTPFEASYATIALEGSGRNGGTALKAQESQPYALDEPVVIPLAFTAESVSGEATISAPEWWEIPADWTLTLVDTKGTEDTSDNVEHELRRDAKNPYSFSVRGSKQRAAKTEQRTGNQSAPTPPSNLRQGGRRLSKSSDSTDSRFRLRINPGVDPLPVEMAELNAQTDEESVLLQWATASETNNAGFYVEHQRLAEGDTSAVPEPDEWGRSGFVEGGGTTEQPQKYRHRVSELDYGKHAFRLRQVDTDGDETMTDVVETEIRLDGSHDVSAPYPNPVRRQATLEVTVREAQPVQVEMYDVLGRRVRTVHDETLPGQQTRRVQISTTDLSSGHYFVRVNGKDFIVTRRMTVVR